MPNIVADQKGDDTGRQRANNISGISSGKANAVKAETREGWALYLDGVSEPYNCRRAARLSRYLNSEIGAQQA